MTTKFQSKKTTAVVKTITPPMSYKGITVTTNTNKPFRAVFYLDGERKHLGYFDNQADAAKAYNKEAKKVFGSVKEARKAKKWNDIPTVI